MCGVGGESFYKRNPFKRNFRKSQKCAQKVMRGQFYKRNPFKINFRKLQNLAKKFLTEDPILLYFFSQNPDPHKEFNFPE